MGCRNCLLGLVCSITLLSQPLLVAQGPKSARVKAIVEKGVAFLEGDLTGYDQMKTVGGPVVVGLAIYKYHDVYGVAGGKNHPKVVKAKANAVDISQTIASPSFNGEKKFYEVGVAAVFLLEVDPDAYRPQIAVLIKAIEAVKSGGPPDISLRPADPALCRGPVAIDTISPAATWRDDWKKTAAERRSRSSWARETSPDAQPEGSLEN